MITGSATIQDPDRSAVAGQRDDVVVLSCHDVGKPPALDIVRAAGMFAAIAVHFIVIAVIDVP